MGKFINVAIMDDNSFFSEGIKWFVNDYFIKNGKLV